MPGPLRDPDPGLLARLRRRAGQGVGDTGAVTDDFRAAAASAEDPARSGDARPDTGDPAESDGDGDPCPPSGSRT
jgi:hypothetical protein